MKMKKLVLIICFLAGATWMFAQSDVTMSLSETMVTDVAENIEVGVTIDYMTPGTTIVGVQLSILYDPAYLSWNGTMAAPAPGVSYQNPGFTPVTPFGDYLWNTNFPGNLIMTWIDPTYAGFPIGNGGDLIRYWFTYNGGLLAGEESPITFSLTAQLKDGGYIKIVNELTDQNFTPMNFIDNPLGGGCGSGLCDGRIYRDSGGPIANTWTGLNSDEWFDGSNWSSGSFPGNSDDVIIPAGTPNNPVIRDYANVKSMVNDGTVTIDPAALGLNAAALIMNNGGQLENNGSIVLLSVFDPGFPPILPSGTFLGQIVPDPIGGLTGTGTYEVQRFMNITSSGTPEYVGWHYVSSPVDGFDTEDIYNFFLNTWDETTGMFSHIEGVDPCTPVSPVLPIGKMQGWSLKEDMDWSTYGCPGGTGNVIEMVGSAWSAPYEIAVTNTATGTYQGFNLVGNPFFCGINFLAVDWTVANANVDPTAYVYQESIQNYITVSGTTPDPFVGNTLPSTLGFFVNANGSGNFTLNGSEQSLAFGAINKTTVDNSLFIKASSSNSFDIMRIYFNEEATFGYDRLWDAYKLFSNADGVPQIYTMGGEDMLATNAMQATEMVPMSFFAKTNGEYTIEAIETSTFSQVYLQDLVTGDVTDLMTSSYTFDYTTGDDANRFIIHFAPVGIGENLMNGVSIWSTDNNIYVSVPKELKGTISVYNMMGQEVVSTDTQPGTNVIPMDNTNTYYVVKVLSSKNAVTGKVYIK